VSAVTPEVEAAATTLAAAHVPILKAIKGGVVIHDFRATGLLPANGGVIDLRVGIEHIPVVPNRVGLGDFYQLAAVLKAQGLGLQSATDSEGNVALFTELNRLCYQARGSNSISYGTENMHLTVGEPWSRRQLRASAWMWQYAEHRFAVPPHGALLGRTQRGGLTPVLKRGHASHQAQSNAAGYHDRVDPGHGYDWQYVEHCVAFFKRHGHFEGA
jgi:hypothetical protein